MTEPKVARSGYVLVTGAKVIKMHRALTALSQRRLEKRENQKRVVHLIVEYLDNANKEIEKLMNNVVKENPVPEGWEGDALPITVSEARQLALLEIEEQEYEIKIPSRQELLKDDDLPKLMKGEEGDRNQKGLGAIMRDLGFLYPSGVRAADRVEDGDDGDSE